MGGVIVLNSGDSPERFWLAAGWIYRDIVRGILEQGGSLSPETRNLLEQAIDPRQMESLDLTRLPATDFRRFRVAAGAAYQIQHQAQGSGWDTPEFWPIYDRMFGELLQLLDQDPRLTDPDAQVLDSWRELLHGAVFSREGSQNQIAIANMLCFHATDSARKRIAERALVDFLNEAYYRYRDGLLQKTQEYWFYAWHDEMAGQLRCSSAPARSESELPFGTKIEVVREPLPVVQAYLASPCNGIVPWSELREDSGPVVAPREHVLTVFGRPIPW